MGQIYVSVSGSFDKAFTHTFSAQSCGHAVAVDNAIRRLEFLKKAAIVQDKRLRDAGELPDDEFSEFDERRLAM